MSKLVRCRQQDSCPNCSMRDREGYCIALSNTAFLKPCPFYKEGDFIEHCIKYKKEVSDYAGGHDYEKEL